MTEDEARQKWCPFVRTASQDINGEITNREMRDRFCIASDCMAWRKSHTGEYGAATVKTSASDGHGWCGLAGKP